MVIQLGNETFKQFEIWTNVKRRNNFLCGNLHKDSTVSVSLISTTRDFYFKRYDIFIENYGHLLDNDEIPTIVRTFDKTSGHVLYYIKPYKEWKVW